VLVAPIVALSVSASSDASSALSYYLTTNVGGAVLEAGLRTEAGPGLSINLSAETSLGISSGMVSLPSDGSPVALVTDIQPGMENQQPISLELDGNGRAISDVYFTLRDPTSGATTTVSTVLRTQERTD
jgi:hypothetical protein